MTYHMALLESKLEGEQQGREEGINSVAVNMLREGLPVDQIQKFTRLTIEKITELAKQIHS